MVIAAVVAVAVRAIDLKEKLVLGLIALRDINGKPLHIEIRALAGHDDLHDIRIRLSDRPRDFPLQDDVADLAWFLRPLRRVVRREGVRLIITILRSATGLFGMQKKATENGDTQPRCAVRIAWLGDVDLQSLNRAGCAGKPQFP